MVAGRSTARYLQVDDAVAHPIAAQNLAGHQPERTAGERQIHPEFAERTLEPVQVRLLVDHPPAAYGGNLVDPVGELVTPVLDMNVGLVVGQVAAVHVCDA